jgi:methionine-rich copper-binding protein CopC
MAAQRLGIVEVGLATVDPQRLMVAHGSIVGVVAAGSFPAVHLVVRRSVAFVACAAAVVVSPGRALAHTQLEFSLPAEGTTVGDPVEEITVGFTDQVALVGNGFEVHDPQGNLLTPFVVTDDNIVFKFQLDPPLGGGLVVVDYHIRAIDGDEQQGSFSFTAAAPVPTAPPPSAASSTNAAPSLPAAETTTPEAATTEAATTEATTTLAAAAEPTVVASTPPDSTLPTDDSDSEGERTLMFAVLIGIAALAAAFLVIRSRRVA